MPKKKTASHGKPMGKPASKASPLPAAKASGKPEPKASAKPEAKASAQPEAAQIGSDDEVTVILGEQDQHCSPPSPDQVDPAVLDHQDEDPLDFNIRVEDEPSSSSTMSSTPST